MTSIGVEKRKQKKQNPFMKLLFNNPMADSHAQAEETIESLRQQLAIERERREASDNYAFLKSLTKEQVEVLAKQRYWYDG